MRNLCEMEKQPNKQTVILQAIEFLKANSGKFDQEKTIVQYSLQRLQEQESWGTGTQVEIEKFLTEALKSPEKYFGY